MRAARLIKMVLLLQSRPSMTAAELARELEVSERTVTRDAQALSEAGVPVYADRGRAGGYRLIGGYRTRLTGLARSEAEALFLSGVPGALREMGLEDAASAARLKVSAALLPSLRDASRTAAQRFHLDAPAWFREPKTPTLLPAIAEAVWADHRLTARYRRGDREVERTLDPYGLVLKAGVWYLCARVLPSDDEDGATGVHSTTGTRGVGDASGTDGLGDAGGPGSAGDLSDADGLGKASGMGHAGSPGDPGNASSLDDKADRLADAGSADGPRNASSLDGPGDTGRLGGTSGTDSRCGAGGLSDADRLGDADGRDDTGSADEPRSASSLDGPNAGRPGGLDGAEGPDGFGATRDAGGIGGGGARNAGGIRGGACNASGVPGPGTRDVGGVRGRGDARARGGFRTYRIDRITAVADHGTRFVRDEAFELPGFWAAQAEGFARSILRAEVVVRLSAQGVRRLAYVVDPVSAREALHSAGDADDEGWVTATLPVESEEVAHTQLMALGPEVEVLAPAALRERFARDAARQAELYGR